MSRIISIVSGKGGAGKTVTAINLAYALNFVGKDVLLLDGDLSNPNIHSSFGVKGLNNSLQKVLTNEIHFSDAIHSHVSGLKVLPNSTSIDDLRDLKCDNFKKLFSKLRFFSDYVIVDSGAGFSDEVIASLEATDEVILVTNPEEISVDATKKIMNVAEELNKTILGVILNKVKVHKHELSPNQIEKMLGYPVVGMVPFDIAIKESQILKHPVSHVRPKSKSAKSFHKISKTLF